MHRGICTTDTATVIKDMPSETDHITDTGICMNTITDMASVTATAIGMVTVLVMVMVTATGLGNTTLMATVTRGLLHQSTINVYMYMKGTPFIVL